MKPSAGLGAAGAQVAVLDSVPARGDVTPGPPAAVRAVVERPPAIRVTAQLEPVPAAVGLRVPDDEQQPEQAAASVRAGRSGPSRTWPSTPTASRGEAWLSTCSSGARSSWVSGSSPLSWPISARRLSLTSRASRRSSANPGKLGWAGPGPEPAGPRQPATRGPGRVREDIGAQVLVHGVDVRLDQQQRHRRLSMILSMSL